MSQKPRGSSIIGGTMWQMSSQLAPLVVNLVLTPFVIVSLGKDVYGLWIVIMTFTAFLGHVDGGITSTVMRYFARFVGAGRETMRQDIGRYVKSLAVAVIVICSVTLLPAFTFAEQIANFFYTPDEELAGAVLLIRVALVTVLVALLRNVVSSVLNAHRLYALTALTFVVGYIAYAVTVFFSLKAGWGLRGMALAAALQALVSFLWIVPKALRLMTLRGSGWMTRQELRAFGALAWKTQVNGLLHMLSVQGLTLIVGRAAPHQRAEFAPGMTFAQQLRSLPRHAGVPIQTALGQTLGRSGETALADHTVRLQKTWVLLVVGWFALAAPASYHAVNIWLPLNSKLPGLIAAILLIGHLWGSLGMVLQLYLLQVKRPDIYMRASFVSTGVLLAGSLIAVDKFGAIGVSIVFVVSQLLGLLLHLSLSKKTGLLPRNPLRDIPWLPAIVCSAATAVATGFVANLLRANQIDGGIGLLLVAASAGPTFLIYLLWAFGPKRLIQIVKTRKLG